MTAIRSARSGIAVGLHALGIGNGTKPEVLATVTRRADEVGFTTLWCGEHVVMVDKPGSRYPYSDDAHFEQVRVNPKPVRDRRLPVIVGGNTDASLGRVAAFGDGWYGFNLPSSALSERLGVLAEQCGVHGRYRACHRGRAAGRA